MIIRVLIINRQLVFAVTIKQALEQTGAFEVHPFTDPRAAMDYLRTHPHDVALVDLTIRTMPGDAIIQGLREIQPEIAIVVSPTLPDSSRVIRDLNLQGMVDMPFSARGIIPVIEHAVEQMSKPYHAITRTLVDPDEATDLKTDILNPPAEAPRTQDQDTQRDTRILDDEAAGADAPWDTRVFPEAEDEDDAPRHQDPPVTRILDDDEPVNLPETRILEDDDAGETAPPPRLPEFTSLDDILAREAPSTLFEPPLEEGDTPPVSPMADSDAVRQFRATTRDTGEFDRMLGEIAPEDQPDDEAELSRSDFEELVNSMRADQPHTPLPDRHQQFVEFILTGGMDTLLSEIEQRKTGPLGEAEEGTAAEAPEPPAPAAKSPSRPPKADRPEAPDTFSKLAAEEPPLPTLEEGGTVSDLMVGVSDTSFRNVLAMMRGENPEDTGSARPGRAERSRRAPDTPGRTTPKRKAPDETPESQAQPPHLPELAAMPPAEPDPEDEPSITAQLILETALDESTPVDTFSLDNVIDSIERQLAEHKPEIQPLPSWKIDSLRRQRPQVTPLDADEAPPAEPDAERYIKEPDFLPESFSEPVAEPAVEEEDTSSSALWEMMQQAEEARAALEQPEHAPEVDQTGEDEAADMLEDTEGQTTAPSAERGTEMIEPPSLPEQVPDDATVVGEPGALPPDMWDDLQDDWDVEADWDSDVLPQTAALHTERPLPEFEDDWDLTVDEGLDEETVAMPRPERLDEPVALGAAADFEPQISAFDLAESDDPYIAQIALSLTQVSLDLAAEATLLTSEDQIVAFAGQLAPQDVEDLRAVLADDWDANPDEARVRFVTLPSSKKDYMLYSRKTVNDFTLTMIFAGSTPLRDIRRQGRRLSEALESVPETLTESDPERLPEVAAMTGEVSAVPLEAPEPVTLQPFTYLWLLRDPAHTFPDQMARAIMAGLGLQLGELGWQVKSLRVQGEYVYVHADVPGERPAYAVIDDLRHRVAEIARAQDPALPVDALWADSYLVMMPGRELDPDEIDQFIAFERMA